MPPAGVELSDLEDRLVRDDDAPVLEADGAGDVAEEEFVGAVEQSDPHQRLVGEDQVGFARGIAFHDGLRSQLGDRRGRFGVPVLVAGHRQILDGAQHFLQLNRRHARPNEIGPRVIDGDDKPKRSHGFQLVDETLGCHVRFGVRVVGWGPFNLRDVAGQGDQGNEYGGGETGGGHAGAPESAVRATQSGAPGTLKVKRT